MPHERHPAVSHYLKWRIMGLRPGLRIAASTLLLACGLQFAHADGSPANDRIWRRAEGRITRHGEAGDCADIKEKGYKVVVPSLAFMSSQYGVS